MQLSNKDLLSIHNLTTSEVCKILTLSTKLKALQKAGTAHKLLAGKTLGMIFNKASTRTRVSFEVGMYQLGGHALYLNDSATQIGRGEPIEDTARVLSRYVDGIMIRTFSHDSVEQLAKFSSVPVINGLTDLLHPCQALTDLFTIQEYKDSFQGRKLTYVGDGNNMANSLMFAAAKVGMDITIACPAAYQPNAEILELAQNDALCTGAKIEITNDPLKACEQADVLYTDVWASMGSESEANIRATALKDYQINAQSFAIAKPDAILLHCLPAHRGEELTAEVFELHAQEIFDQAENRLHVQKAIMALLMSPENLL